MTENIDTDNLVRNLVTSENLRTNFQPENTQEQRTKNDTVANKLEILEDKAANVNSEIIEDKTPRVDLNYKTISQYTNKDVTELAPEGKFIVRPCHHYYSEFEDCMSFRARFHQRFIYGEYSDCNPWRWDYENCIKWENSKNPQAYLDLVESEKHRRLKRLVGHVKNDVWKRREKPPENWYSELPKHLSEGHENSFLEYKAKPMRAGDFSDLDPKPACTIL